MREEFPSGSRMSMKKILLKVFRRVRRIVWTAIGKDFSISPDRACAMRRFGTEYGGWNIVEGSVSRNSVIYSFGIGEDASFDIGLIEEYGCMVHAFDPTPRAMRWVEKQNFPHEFIVHEYGLGVCDGEMAFFPPKNKNHVSYSILERPDTEAEKVVLKVKSLASIMKDLRHSYIDILKMDIEGGEYAVIDNLSASGVFPQQILVEFHHRFPGIGIQKTKDAIAKLKGMGYLLFSVSSSGEEYSFVHRSKNPIS